MFYVWLVAGGIGYALAGAFTYGAVMRYAFGYTVGVSRVDWQLDAIALIAAWFWPVTVAACISVWLVWMVVDVIGRIVSTLRIDRLFRMVVNIGNGKWWL